MTWTIDAPLGVVVGTFPQATGRFYDSGLAASYTTVALSANVLYAVPFLVPKTVTYSALVFEVTTQSAGNNARLGIYSDTNGAPDALVLDGGTVSLTGTGAKTVVISQSLTAGAYWLAYVSNGTPSVRATSATSANPSLGFTSGTDTTVHTGWSVAFAYAALPNPFTGGGALITTAGIRLMAGL